MDIRFTSEGAIVKNPSRIELVEILRISQVKCFAHGAVLAREMLPGRCPLPPASPSQPESPASFCFPSSAESVSKPLSCT